MQQKAPRSLYCSPQNIDIHYSEWNPGGEPVLLLHGLADHGLVWSSLGEALGDRFHVVAPDLRGHGDSSKPDGGYSTEAIITDLRGLMQHLGWEKVHILGHSWSAKVICIWARQFPEDFQTMILVDPAFIQKFPHWIRAVLPLFYHILPFLKIMGPFATYSEAETLGRSLKQFQGWTPLQQLVFQFTMEPKPGGRWGSKFVVAARNEIFEDMLQTTGLTTKILIPTLFVQPEQGLNRFPWQLLPYRKFFSNLQVVSVPGNHWAFLVEPRHFNSTIRKFLEEMCF